MWFHRAARLVLLSGFCLAALASAQARDHGVRQPAQQDREFYATAPAPSEAVVTPAASHGCFVTNSPMESTKGIRHWSNHC
jgi:hypothetical protein